MPLSIAEKWNKYYKQINHLHNEHTVLTAAEI